MAKTTTRFLEGVKRRISNPANQVLLDDEDMLDMADDVMQLSIVPLMLSVRQDYYVTSEDEATVANQAEYSIPYRAIARGLRDLKLRDAAGSTRDLSLIALEDAHLYRQNTDVIGFYFKGDKIVLVNTPTVSTLTLEKWYNRAPSKFCLVDDAGLVTNISGNNVTINAVPSTFVAGAVIDFVQGKSGNSILDMDVEILGVNGAVISFTSGDVPSSLVVGDYISLAQTSPVLQCPDEIQPYLETETAIHILQALGDFENMKVLKEHAAEELKAAKQLLEPRISGENTKIINRYSLLRGRRANFWRGMTW